MANHFYAIFGTYHPNSAVTNRMLSYLEAWSHMECEVTVVFTEPDRKFSRLNSSYKNITVTYLWDIFSLKNYIFHRMMYFLYVKTFINKLHSDDKVYLYGEPYFLNKLLRKRPDAKVFQERTEHPMVFNSGNWPYCVSLKTYLQDCKKINGLFVISQPLKEYFVSIGMDSQKVHIVNMTVDASRFMGIKKREQSKRYIAYCGKASNNKDGVDQLIKAFALVNEKYPDIYLYIIGQAPNPKEVNNNVKLVENLGVSGHVVFTGVVSSSDMPQMLTDAIILALDRPDNLQAKYGFPTKLGEYLLTGNPVVVTRVGDIPRFIENGVSGMVAEPSNSEDFASKLCWLLENPEKARTIGEQGKKVAMGCFNNEIEARKIINTIFR